MNDIGLALSTVMFSMSIMFLFVGVPFAAIAMVIDDESDMWPKLAFVLAGVSIPLMFFGGVGMSTFMS